MNMINEIVGIKVSRKDEVFNTILEIVVDEMEISREEILSKSKNRDVVVARSVLVSYLKNNGFSTKSIATRLNKTPAAIIEMMSFYKEKTRIIKMIQINLSYMNKELESKGFNA